MKMNSMKKKIIVWEISGKADEWISNVLDKNTCEIIEVLRYYKMHQK